MRWAILLKPLSESFHKNVTVIRRYKRTKTNRDSAPVVEKDFGQLKLAKYQARRDVDILKYKRGRKLADEYRDHLNSIDYTNLHDVNFNTNIIADGYENEELRFSNPIEGTVKGMVSEIITTLIIELSIRRIAFQDIPDSKVLLKSVPLLDDEQIRSQLSGTQVKELLDRMNNNVNFTSLAYFRNIYTSFKSNDWLAYLDSDFTRYFKSDLTGYTERYECDDLMDEIIPVFKAIDVDDPLSKIEGMVKIAHVLLRSSCPPSTKMFRVLVDQLDRHNMITYEQIVLKYLIPFKSRSSLLSDEFDKINSSLIVHYFQDIIEKDPEFINTLFNFYDKLGNKHAMKHLLSFMKFDEILELERIYNLSMYGQLLSKSRYLRSRKITDLTLVNYHTSKPLKISKQSFYNILEKCIDNEMFQYIDFMINKVIFQSLDDSVLLAFPDKELKFIIDNENINEIIVNIFDKNMIRLIMNTVNKSSDVGRLMWLIPNLDILLAHQTSNNSLDVDMIKMIILTLRTFGLDGKVVSYEKLLNLHHESA